MILNIIGKKNHDQAPNKNFSPAFTDRSRPPRCTGMECGSKKEPLIRRLIMSVEIKPRPTEGQLRLVREISGIANNINQITRLANTVKSVSPAQVEELQRLCSEALSLVRESL